MKSELWISMFATIISIILIISMIKSMIMINRITIITKTQCTYRKRSTFLSTHFPPRDEAIKLLQVYT